MSVLKVYLKKYSLQRISEITNIDQDTLQLMREGKLKNYIQQIRGKVIPTFLIVNNQLKTKMKEYLNNK